MKAREEEARAKARTTPTEAQGRGLAVKMWELLGSKTRYADQIGKWMGYMGRCWRASEFTWEEFEKIVIWAVKENEFTVRNLLTARNPGESLFERQWDNVSIFYEADMAGRKIQERKSWTYGACFVCDERPAPQRGRSCRVCEHRWAEADAYVDEAGKRNMVWVNKEYKHWWLHEGDNNSPLIAEGDYTHTAVEAIKDYMMENENEEDLAKLRAVVVETPNE
jgi:hypothetical protein